MPRGISFSRSGRVRGLGTEVSLRAKILKVTVLSPANALRLITVAGAAVVSRPRYCDKCDATIRSLRSCS